MTPPRPPHLQIPSPGSHTNGAAQFVRLARQSFFAPLHDKQKTKPTRAKHNRSVVFMVPSTSIISREHGPSDAARLPPPPPPLHRGTVQSQPRHNRSLLQSLSGP